MKLFIGSFIVVCLISSISVARNPHKSPPPPPPPPPPSAAFYVATNGSDSNPGTLAAPFATLGKCQQAMRGGSNEVCYIRAGMYSPPSAGGCSITSAPSAALIMGSSDSGETWSYYPPDGYNSALISGGGTVDVGFCVGGGAASAITFNGLKFAGFVHQDITTRSPIVAVNNEFTGITGTGCCDNTALLVSSTNSTISHNYFHDLSGIGVDLSSGYSGGTYPAFSNATVSNNFFLNTCSGAQDCGAIYCFDHGTTYSTNILFTNNYIRDVYKAGNGGVTLSGNGIYNDEGCSNSTIVGNVVTGITGSCFFNHGGANNVAEGNICDEQETSGTGVAAFSYQWISTPGGGTGSGNVAAGNIIVADTGTGGTGFFVACYVSTWPHPLNVNPSSPPTASDFYDFGAGTMNHGVLNCGAAGTDVTGNGDTNSQNVNPGMPCADSYPTTSSLLGSPVSFPAMPSGWNTPGFWGPPGFVDPLIGNAPSWNPTFSCR